MSAKRLGTLAMIYATDELQNPLPRKTMLCEGDMNSAAGRSDAILHSKVFRLSIQHCITGERGFYSHW